MPRLSISLLGSFQVTRKGRQITNFATDQTRALLAYLAIESDRPHRRDALAGLLWPDADQSAARHNLRQALSFLKRALKESGQSPPALPLLLSTRETIQFNSASDHWIDVVAFSTAIKACQEHRHRDVDRCPPCLRRAEQAISLYRGEFLSGFYLEDSNPFEEWALLQREWLHNRAIDALTWLGNQAERRGDLQVAKQYAMQQMTLAPWREKSYRRLMQLLAADGERSAALAHYERCCRVLDQEFGIAPTAQTKMLKDQIQNGGGIPLCTAPHRLPQQMTPFVGKSATLAELAEILADPDCRLLTLAGPGGIGKTRLALQAANAQRGNFADGIYFVAVGPIQQVEHLAPAIATLLDIPLGEERPSDRLVDALCDKDMLLILDNLEHLVEARQLIHRMLHAAPGVVILATSRERLNLRWEWVYPVQGLAYAPEDTEAMALFRQCARRAGRDLSSAEVPHIARICCLVEGMPLGIELAAAWTPVFACAEIADEIERTIDILTSRLANIPERHRSIRAMFEHSWMLLTASEQDQLARLSVFCGGFTTQAAKKVTETPPMGLSTLIDKSLIRQAGDGRYEMHELLRQSAATKLAERPGLDTQTLLAHARYYSQLVQEQHSALRYAKRAEAFVLVQHEFENVRRAWHTAVAWDQAKLICHMVDSLYLFCSIQCRFEEGIELFVEAIERWHEEQEQSLLVSKMLSRCGALCRHIGQYTRAAAYLQKGLKLAQALNLPADQVFCLVHLANVARSEGRYDASQQLAQQGLALAHHIGNSWGLAFSLFLLGLIHYRRGELEKADQLLQQGLSAARASQDTRRVISTLSLLGDIASYRGHYTDAIRLFDECLALSRALGDRFNAALQLNNLGTVYHVQQKHDRAAACYEDSLDICRAIGDLSGQAIALINLGELAFDRGAYRLAQRHYQQSLALGRKIQDQWAIANCLKNLGVVYGVLNQAHKARRCFAEAIQTAVAVEALTILPPLLLCLAESLARHGETERAVMLLSIVLNHPMSEQASRDQATQLLDNLGLAPATEPPQEIDQIVQTALDGIILETD